VRWCGVERSRHWVCWDAASCREASPARRTEMISGGRPAAESIF
jgi:hypothetical protein